MYAVTRSEYIRTTKALSRTLEMAKIGLLIERSLIQAERIDDVVDLNGSILHTLVGLLSRCVGPSVCHPMSVN